MNKQTKTFAMVGILAVGGYLIYKQYNKPKSFSGGVGRRVGLTGVSENMALENSQWVRPTLNGQKLGLTGVAENMSPESSNWIRPSLNRRKMGLTGIENETFTNSGWVRPSLNGQKLGLTGIENVVVRPSRFAWR